MSARQNEAPLRRHRATESTQGSYNFTTGTWSAAFTGPHSRPTSGANPADAGDGTSDSGSSAGSATNHRRRTLAVLGNVGKRISNAFSDIKTGSWSLRGKGIDIDGNDDNDDDDYKDSSEEEEEAAHCDPAEAKGETWTRRLKQRVPLRKQKTTTAEDLEDDRATESKKEHEKQQPHHRHTLADVLGESLSKFVGKLTPSKHGQGHLELNASNEAINDSVGVPSSEPIHRESGMRSQRPRQALPDEDYEEDDGCWSDSEFDNVDSENVYCNDPGGNVVQPDTDADYLTPEPMPSSTPTQPTTVNNSRQPPRRRSPPEPVNHPSDTHSPVILSSVLGTSCQQEVGDDEEDVYQNEDEIFLSSSTPVSQRPSFDDGGATQLHQRKNDQQERHSPPAAAAAAAAAAATKSASSAPLPSPPPVQPKTAGHAGSPRCDWKHGNNAKNATASVDSAQDVDDEAPSGDKIKEMKTKLAALLGGASSASASQQQQQQQQQQQVRPTRIYPALEDWNLDCHSAPSSPALSRRANMHNQPSAPPLSSSPCNAIGSVGRLDKLPLHSRLHSEPHPDRTSPSVSSGQFQPSPPLPPMTGRPTFAKQQQPQPPALPPRRASENDTPLSPGTVQPSAPPLPSVSGRQPLSRVLPGFQQLSTGPSRRPTEDDDRGSAGSRPISHAMKPLPVLPSSASNSPVLSRRHLNSHSDSVESSRPTIVQSRSTSNLRFHGQQHGSMEGENLSSAPWYFGSRSREECKSLLEVLRMDGSFVIRDSQRGGRENPFALSVLHNRIVYNLLVRLKPNRKYALGTEKHDEPEFSTLSEMVAYHRREPIYLSPAHGLAPADVCLTLSPPKRF